MGNKLDQLSLGELGQAARIEVSQSETMIVGGKGKKKAIEQRCNQLRNILASEESE